MNDTYIDALEAELIAAAARRRRLALARVPTPPSGAITAAAVVVLCAVVASLALQLGGVRHAATTHTRRGPVATGRAELSVLLRRYAALRRPRRSTDAFPATLAQPYGIAFGTERLLGRLPDDERVYVSLAGPQRTSGLYEPCLIFIGPFNADGVCGGPGGNGVPLSTPGGYWVQLVPDTVRHVMWASVSANRSKRYIAAARVAGNLAFTRPLSGVFSRSVWYGAGGVVVSTSTPPTTPTVRTLVPLKSSGSVARGRTVVSQVGASYQLEINGAGLAPNRRGDAYAVWLRGPGGHDGLLGFVNPGVGRNGKLHTAGALPADVRSYREIVVSLEHTARPRHPGLIVLAGPLRL